MTFWIIIALAAFIVVLSVLSIYGVIPAMRIVPDDTKFDFTRFRRISFPISAVLSILAIVLYFTHGLNFGIDFRGGTLIEIQQKGGPADIAQLRSTLGGLGLGEVQLQLFGSPSDVLIRIAQQPAHLGDLRGGADHVRADLRVHRHGVSVTHMAYTPLSAHCSAPPGPGVRLT